MKNALCRKPERLTQEQQRLVEENIKLVGFTITKYFPTSIMDEDLYQIGCIGLMKSAMKYDPNKGSFSTYAVFYIRGEIQIHIRNSYALNRIVHRHTVSISDPVTDDGKLTVENLLFDEGFEDAQMTRLITQELLCELNEIEKKVIHLYYVDGLTQTQIGKVVGRDQNFSSRLIRKVSSKMKDKYEQLVG